MDLESTMETAVSYFPENLGLSGILIDTAYYLPTQLDFVTVTKFLLFFGMSALVICTLGRIVLGRHSSLNHSVSCVMGILFVYAVTVVAYSLFPPEFRQRLAPLPFVTFSKDYLLILQFGKVKFAVMCREILSMIMLAFMINLLDTLIPKGKTVLGWFILRFLAVLLAIAAHNAASQALNTYLPDLLVLYAPTVLLFVLLAMLVLGFMNAILGLFLVIVNPVIGALYTFFFSNIIGKQVTKAFFTSAILVAIFYLLDHSGYTVISLSLSGLTGYIPLTVVSLLLWYLIGHIL